MLGLLSGPACPPVRRATGVGPQGRPCAGRAVGGRLAVSPPTWAVTVALALSIATHAVTVAAFHLPRGGVRPPPTEARIPSLTETSRRSSLSGWPIQAGFPAPGGVGAGECRVSASCTATPRPVSGARACWPALRSVLSLGARLPRLFGLLEDEAHAAHGRAGRPRTRCGRGGGAVNRPSPTLGPLVLSTGRSLPAAGVRNVHPADAEVPQPGRIAGQQFDRAAAHLPAQRRADRLSQAPRTHRRRRVPRRAGRRLGRAPSPATACCTTGARPRQGRHPLSPRRHARRGPRPGRVDDLEVRRHRRPVRRRQGRRRLQPEGA